MSSTIFQIEQGQLAFSVVDTSATGYSDDWQTPTGAGVESVTIADYDTNSPNWSCQTTNGALNASPNDNDVEVPATFCGPAQTIPQPGETSFTLDVELLQDPNVVNGLVRFLVEYDTQEAYFLLGLDGDNPPKAVGRCKLQASAFGGPARETLTATVSLPCSRKPQFLFGDASASEAVPASAVTP